MRSAKEQEYFPYGAKRVCYILVTTDGVVEQVPHTKGDFRQAYDVVIHHGAKLYAVWPGEWRSDLFAVDDIEAFAKGVGIL